MISLDTHILLHALAGKLRKRERDLLEANRWGIASIVMWEIAKLAELGRIELDLESRGFKSAMSSIHVWPLDLATAILSTRLDFSGDPADQIIVATSISHGVPLLTRDKKIRKSRLVALV